MFGTITKAFLGLTLLATSILSFSQTTNLRLTLKSIVKDSSGTIIPYDVWKDLLLSGEYRILPINPNNENSEYFIFKIGEKEKQKIINTTRPPESRYFTTGKTIENFKTEDIYGNKVNLKTLKGKIVVINFWFISCEPCRREIPELNTIVSDYKDSSNVVFLAVALDDNKSLQDFLVKNSFAYTIIDDGRWIANLYGIQSYPTHLILDKTGKVYFHTSGYGFATAKWIKRSIDELLNENKDLKNN